MAMVFSLTYKFHSIAWVIVSDTKCTKIKNRIQEPVSTIECLNFHAYIFHFIYSPDIQWTYQHVRTYICQRRMGNIPPETQKSSETPSLKGMLALPIDCFMIS